MGIKMPTGCQYMPIDELVMYQKNPKKHTKKQIDKIIESINKSGWGDPIVVCPETNEILSGNGRYLAAKKMGLENVPVVYAPEGMSEEQKARLVIASNKLVEETGYNEYLEQLVVEFDFDFIDVKESQEEKKDFEFDTTIPQYTPKGLKVRVDDCLDDGRLVALIDEINNADIDDDEKRLLIAGAYRLCRFNYKNVAEYYVKASPVMQGLMEKMALVIIDYDSAIANGFTTLTKDLMEMVDE